MRRPHGSNRTDTLLPYTTLFRARRGKAGEYQRHFIAGLDPELQARALADFRWQLVTGAVVESVDVVGTVVVRRQARCDVRGQRQIRVDARARRSEEHTSELQSLMRISYAVFCLKKKQSHSKDKSTEHVT